MSSEKRLWVNIIGKAGAGKSTVAEFYHDHFGFEIFRPSDVLRGFAHANGFKLTRRQDYVDIHQEMVSRDPDVMVRKVLDNPAPRLAIDGLRVPLHVNRLRRAGMLTLALVCPDDVRADRILQAQEWRRYRDSSNLVTPEEVLADEAVDSGNPHDLSLPDVEAVMEMADLTIDTNKSPDAVRVEATMFLVNLGVVRGMGA